MKSFIIEIPVDIPVTGHIRPPPLTGKMTTFEEYKRRKALGLDTRIPRKYIGPIDDPHFVPTSPVISRQVFTAQQENDLHQSCALVLAQIPHSDEMDEDPARYLMKQITAQQKRLAREEKPSKERKDWKEWRRERHAANAAAAAAAAALNDTVPLALPEPREESPVSAPRSILSSDEDSATSSETSKRETLRTDRSTPWTTPGFTPGEATCPSVPEPIRPSTAHTSSNLKTELKAFRQSKHNSFAFLKDVGPNHTMKATQAAKSMTHLPGSDRSRSRDKTEAKPQDKEPSPSKKERRKSKKKSSSPMNNPNMNKSLPTLPRRQQVEPTIRLIETTSPSSDRHFVPRQLKTNKRSKTQPESAMEYRSMSADPEHILRTTISEQDQPPSSPPKKKAFDFHTFFQRRKHVDGKDLMVAAAA